MFLNNGAGQFTSVSNAITDGVSRTHSLVVADFDGDGDLDVFEATGFAVKERNRQFRNDGGGTFVEVTTSPFSTGAKITPFVTLADFDGVTSALDHIIPCPY